MDQSEVVSKEFWLAALAREGGAFRAAVSQPDPAAAVPSCPEWTVRDLTVHLGRVYTFVREVLETGKKPPHQQPRPAGNDVLPWFDEVSAAVQTRLGEADPASSAWNWSTQPKLAGFWPRRMAHETAVHRWDAQLVSGTAEPVEAELAADGVTEVLDTWLPSGRATSQAGATGVVRLDALDLDRTWLIRLRAEGIILLDESAVLDESADAQTVVGATASDLLLALWGRRTASSLSVAGDPARFVALQVG